MNQFNIIKIYTIFTQQQDTNSNPVPIDYKPGGTETYPGIQNKVQKFLSRSKGIEITQSYHCGIMLKIIIKRYLKITHIFSSRL